MGSRLDGVRVDEIFTLEEGEQVPRRSGLQSLNVPSP